MKYGPASQAKGSENTPPVLGGVFRARAIVVNAGEETTPPRQQGTRRLGYVPVAGQDHDVRGLDEGRG
ncbi:MAG TPA: hypothetical protein VGP38_10910, partial [Rubrobacter sp.]|nr:hypothetical protein [Rubrobacter sp.]